MSKPTISVIIPTYNREKFLRRAIKSVLYQTFTDYELIVVDDASKDRTADVVDSFADIRIQYLRHEKNKGGSAARNTGIKNALGRYIALLDDDDEWMKEKLERQLSKLLNANEKVGLVYTGMIVKDSNNETLTTYLPHEKGDLRKRLLSGTTIGSPTPLIKKECFESVGLFDETLSSCQDWDMWKRISEQYEFDYVPEVLAKLHMHGSQISTNLASMIPGRIAMVRKHADSFEKHPEIYVIHLKRIGKLHCLNGTYRHAMHWFLKATKVRFWEIFKIIAWLIIEFPRTKWFSFNREIKKYYPSKPRNG